MRRTLFLYFRNVFHNINLKFYFVVKLLTVFYVYFYSVLHQNHPQYMIASNDIIFDSYRSYSTMKELEKPTDQGRESLEDYLHQDRLLKALK